MSWRIPPRRKPFRNNGAIPGFLWQTGLSSRVSKAFTKEDAEEPQRSGRVRSRAGLAPGATNYLSSEGAFLLQQELQASKTGDPQHSSYLADILAHATIVPSPSSPPQSVIFGTVVDLEGPYNNHTYRIVGLDETHLFPDAIAWNSSLAKALLGNGIGHKLRIDGELFSIVRLMPLSSSGNSPTFADQGTAPPTTDDPPSR